MLFVDPQNFRSGDQRLYQLRTPARYRVQRTQLEEITAL